MFKRILLASDGSECALHAARVAAELTQKHEAELTVLHVFRAPLSTIALYGVPGIGVDPAELQVLESDVHREILERTAEVLRETGTAFTERREAGHPAEIILQVANEEKSELIILGSHGHSSVHAFLLGSVSDRIAHHAHCSVLLVK